MSWKQTKFNAEQLLVTRAYNIVFPWTDPAFDDQELCNFITAGTAFAFYEIKWVEGSDCEIVIDGISFGNAPDLEEAKIMCHAAFVTTVVKGLAMVLAMGVRADKEFKQSAWNVDNLRAFVRDQAYGVDLLSDKNISEILAILEKQNYTQSMMESEEEAEQSGHFQVEAVKPTIH